MKGICIPHETPHTMLPTLSSVHVSSRHRTFLGDVDFTIREHRDLFSILYCIALQSSVKVLYRYLSQFEHRIFSGPRKSERNEIKTDLQLQWFTLLIIFDIRFSCHRELGSNIFPPFHLAAKTRLICWYPGIRKTETGKNSPLKIIHCNKTDFIRYISTFHKH